MLKVFIVTALTVNLIAPAVLLDVLAALLVRALLARALDFLLGSLLLNQVLPLHAGLVLIARFALVVRTIACHTSFGTTRIAHAHILLSLLLALLRLDASTTAGVDGDLSQRLVNLAGLALRREAPTPAGNLLLDATTLEFVEFLVGLLGGVHLDHVVLHDLGTFRAGELVVGRRLQLRSDPGLEAWFAGVVVVLTVGGGQAFGKRGCGERATADRAVELWRFGLGLRLSFGHASVLVHNRSGGHLLKTIRAA